jgi:cysteine desulfurase
MQANNETGVIQPIPEIAQALEGHEAFFHVDAAQGFGKVISPLQDKRIDLISISGHKIFGPKGIGALVSRRRGFKRPPLTPLMLGGGQEHGLRPGTLPVHLIVGLGLASELALGEADERREQCLKFRQKALQALSQFDPQFNGDQDRVMPHVLNLSIEGLDSEAVMVALKNEVAISNGSACTSQTYGPSHVLEAMQLEDERIEGALRISWCHMTPDPNWDSVVAILSQLRYS